MSQEIISQAPNIIPVLTDPANLTVNIILALVTFLAVLVALFQGPIKKFFDKAKLKVEISLCSPDCHKISIRYGGGSSYIPSFYIRIKVSNISRVAAERIEVMPINFWRIEDEVRIKVSNFLPISFVWSHFQPRANEIRIPAGMFRYCDFGHFIKNRGNNEMRLFLDTMVQPNQLSDGKHGNIIDPGVYQFELLVTGDNIKPVKKMWEIEFKEWSDDEQDMINNKIRLKEFI